MKFRAVILFILLSCSALWSTPRTVARTRPSSVFDWDGDFRLGPRIAFSWQQHGAFEIGAHMLILSAPYRGIGSGYEYEHPKGLEPEGFWNAGFAFEFPFGVGKFTVGPKLFTEFNAGPFSSALNLTTYINNENVDFRVTPEIGLSFAGYFGARYGYSFAPTGPQISEIGQHRITVFLVLVPPRIHNM